MNSNLHSKFLIAMGITVIAIILMLLETVSDIFLWIGIALALIASAILLTIRCPHCGYRLVRKNTWRLPNFCPNCGKKISANEHED